MIEWLKSKLIFVFSKLIKPLIIDIWVLIDPTIFYCWEKFKAGYKWLSDFCHQYKLDQVWFKFKYFLIGKYHCQLNKWERLLCWVVHKFLWVNIIVGLSWSLMQSIPWVVGKAVSAIFWVISFLVSLFDIALSLIGILF